MRNATAISMCLAATLVLGAGAPRAWARPVQRRRATADSAPAREPARAMLKMDVKLAPSQRTLYVEQTVPVTIRAYFLGGTGVTVNGHPHLTSDAWILSDVPAEPRQASVQVHGLPYTALVWEGKLTAVKAGPARTELELPVALTYREAPRLRSLPSADAGAADDESGGADEDPFASLLRQTPFASDPFFAQMFNGRDPLRGMFDDLAGAVRQREVTLRDPGVSLDVADPPDPRPAGFTGAVGSFELGAALPDEAFRVGEPTHLKLTVRGEGSFARLALDGLPTTSELSTYGITSEFTPGPRALGGEKVFTQTITPRRAGALTIPAVSLTYFDPRSRQYVTRHSPPLRITVAPAPAGADVASAALAAPPGGDAERLASPATPNVPDVHRTTLAAPFQTASFWMLVGGLVLATIVLSLLGWSRRRGLLNRLWTRRRVRREVARQRRQIGAAAARGDAPALFGAGRRALQARLAAAWGVPAEAIATADVTTRLGARGARIRGVFEQADRAAYAGAAPGVPAGHGRNAPSDLEGWRDVILQELNTLESRA